MKLKKVLSATFAALVLSSSLCFASVSTRTINETTMKTKCTDRARCSIYVKNGSSYTEYYSNRSAKEAALEIAQAVGSSAVEAYSSNPVLYRYLKDFGEIRDMASMRIPGIDVYHFTFRPSQQIN